MNFLNTNKFSATIINRKILQWLPIFWIAIFFVLPILLLFVFSFLYLFNAANFNEIEQIALFLLTPEYIQSIKISLVTSTVAAIICSILGFYFAYFVTFLRSKIKYFIFGILIFIFLLNPVILFQAISSLISQDGIINNFLITKNYIENPIIINHFWIIIICLVYKFLPIVYFLSANSFKKNDIDLTVIESSLDLGANRFYIFKNLIFNKNKKIIYLSFIFVFLLCFGNVSTSISSYCSNALFGSKLANEFVDFSNIFAGILQVLPFVAVTLLLAIDYSKDFETNGKSFAENQIISKYKCLSIGKEPITVIINSFVIIFFLIAIAFFVLKSFFALKSFTVGEFYNIFEFFDNFSFQLYQITLQNNYILESAKNTFIIATFAALISTVLGSMLGLSASKFKDLHNNKFTKIILLSIVFSEIIIGISFAFATRILGLENNLIPAIIGLSVCCLFFSTIIIYTQIQSADKNIESSSLDLGANYFQTFFKVTFPTVFPIISSCFLLMFVFAFNEFAVSYFTVSGELPILSGTILELSKAYSPLIYSVSALIILLSILIISIGSLNANYNKYYKRIKNIIIILILFFAIFLII